MVLDKLEADLALSGSALSTPKIYIRAVGDLMESLSSVESLSVDQIKGHLASFGQFWFIASLKAGFMSIAGLSDGSFGWWICQRLSRRLSGKAVLHTSPLDNKSL